MREDDKEGRSVRGDLGKAKKRYSVLERLGLGREDRAACGTRKCGD